MKRIVFSLSLLALVFTSYGQYLRIAEEGKVWYSRGFNNGLAGENSIFTTILAVEGDTLIGAKIHPLLLEKDSSLATTDTLAYIDEDTLAGTLAIHFFDPNRPDQYFDFSLNKGDTVNYNMPVTGVPNQAQVDSVYYFTDFRGVTRKVITFEEIYSLYTCWWVKNYSWIEGLGCNNILTTPLPECAASHVPGYKLQCVFADSLKIYGDTVQKCYFEKLSLEEIYWRKAEIFPNPVQGDFIEVSSETPIGHLEILDNLGQLVVKLENPESLIDISALPPGTYLLIYQNVEREHFIEKMIRR